MTIDCKPPGRHAARSAGVLAASALLAASAVLAASPKAPAGIGGRLVAHFQMQPIPQEGGWFSPTYSSGDKMDGGVLPARFGEKPHAAASAIVGLLTPRDFSAMHRLQSDEVWHFYGGSTLKMLLLYPDGHGETVMLGSNVLGGELSQVTVPHGVWQGAYPVHSSARTYSFFGTQLSPAFDSADFEMGYRDELQRRYPAMVKDIARLTRAEFAVSPPNGPAKVAPVQSAAVFSATDVPALAASPGVTLQELVGRLAPNAKTATLSVAKFTLAPGRSSGTSLNHHSLEVFIVTDGTGAVRVGGKETVVRFDSTVFIPPEEPHSIQADDNSTLTFYAISSPAFSPEDYAVVKP